MANKKRLDILVVEKGLAESRSKAQGLIMAGEVWMGDRVLDKPGMKISINTKITVRGKPPFVSRGGLKLQAAIDTFAPSLKDIVAADVGASTGGFTDCLLQHGAAKVFAIDAGHGQLAWKLRNDPRVVVMERTNARYLNSLPETIALATIDVSFISLRLILPAVMGWLEPDGQIIALIKPQFEVERRQVGKGGVVRDKAAHRYALRNVLRWAAAHNLYLHGLIPSPLTGPAGNIEFLAQLTKEPEQAVEIEAAITRSISMPKNGQSPTS